MHLTREVGTIICSTSYVGFFCIQWWKFSITLKILYSIFIVSFEESNSTQICISCDFLYRYITLKNRLFLFPHLRGKSPEFITSKSRVLRKNVKFRWFKKDLIRNQEQELELLRNMGRNIQTEYRRKTWRFRVGSHLYFKGKFLYLR